MSASWDEVLAVVGGHHFMVDDLQACEPGELMRRSASDDDLPEAPYAGSPRAGVWVAVGEDRDSMGFHRAEVRASTREGLLDFVALHWGKDDPDWWANHVEARVMELHAAPRAARRGGRPRWRELVLRLDVTGLDEAEVDYLAGELSAQAEPSEGHPNVAVLSLEVEGVPRSVAAGALARLSDNDRERMGHIIAGEGDWFSAALLRLIAKSDRPNRDAIASLYPDHVEAFLEWRGDRTP